MEALDLHNSLKKSIYSLLAKIKQQTGYQNFIWEVKDGGVYISHSSNIPICYATIQKDGSLEELYYPDFKKAIVREIATAVYFGCQIDRETMEQSTYQSNLDEKRKKILSYLQQQKEWELVFQKQKDCNLSRARKVQRTRTMKRIERLLLTLSIGNLIGFGNRRVDEILTRQEQYSLIMDYVAEDPDVLLPYTTRLVDNKHPFYPNADIACAIMETGKNPWPMLSDLLEDLRFTQAYNFPSVVDALHRMNYFPYNYETLVDVAMARGKDGNCDIKKLSQYMRERAIYAIIEARKKAMIDQEKEELNSFLNSLFDFTEDIEMKKTGKGMGI